MKIVNIIFEQIKVIIAVKWYIGETKKIIIHFSTIEIYIPIII